MRRMCAALCGVWLAVLPMAAWAGALKPELGGLAFLVGRWTAGAGRVAETGGTSRGTSVISVEAGGAVLLRRDHVALFGKTGRPAGGFDILMTIYAEGGGVRADYFDGSHVIHYTSAVVVAGKSVVFSSAGGAGAPVFRLRYTLAGDRLGVSFAMAPPGAGAFQPIAEGTLRLGG